MKKSKDSSNNSNECQIFDVFAEAYQCNDENQFLVDVGFEYQNIPGNTFSILGNGMNYGTFEYGESFYTIGPLLGDCETLYEFVIVDNTLEDCSAATWFEEPICCEEEQGCTINEIEVFDVVCINEDSFEATIN